MLAINEEFESYQGEGKNTGVRMYFVRTQGCAVGCHFCDTKQSWKAGSDTVDEFDIIGRANGTMARWICITGGEPLEQDLSELVRLAKDSNYKVQLETSGMYFQPCIKDMDWISVSPKELYAKKGLRFRNEILEYADELKCVVTKPSEIDYYVEEYRDFHKLKTFQPVDSDPTLAKHILNRRGSLIADWKLMIQQHKVLDLR